jgi:hypothetical protein
VWTFKEDGGSMSEGTVAFAQRYQRIGGSVSVAGKSQPMLAAALRGDDLRFAYVDADQNLRTAHVKVSGRHVRGHPEPARLGQHAGQGRCGAAPPG